MARHVISAVLLWAALTAVGEASLFLDWFPVVGAHEAEDFDRIFLILIAMGMPVFAFVVAVLMYSMLQFRVDGPTEGGATFMGKGTAPRVWVGITSALAITVMIFPGMTGLAKLSKEPEKGGWGEYEADLVIHATGLRWFWQFEYPESGITLRGTADEVVLPVDTKIRFDVDSGDVIHSLWIPAFRLKIDALPGRTTFFTVKTTEIGDYEQSAAFRAQCAELCGMDHAGMVSKIRVVSQEDFRTWVDSQAKGE